MYLHEMIFMIELYVEIDDIKFYFLRFYLLKARLALQEDFDCAAQDVIERRERWKGEGGQIYK